MSTLTLHTADPAPKIPEGKCAMSMTCGLNFISQLRSNDISFSEHDGPLSIKCAFGGSEFYEIEGSRLMVDDSCYLVLNQDQRYASSIQVPASGPASSVIESFCLWFRPSFAEQLLTSLTTPADRLLDDPNAINGMPITFFERSTPHDDLVSPILRRIHRAANTGAMTSAWLEDQMHASLETLLQARRGVYKDVERLPAVRFSTRLELYRRLHRAKDFLDASLDTPVSLSDIAAVACLSPHHFLRTFKTAFSETPHQYLGRKRMERARNLVINSETPITQICYDLGFESLGSFSWLFRRTYGLSPRQLRDNHVSRTTFVVGVHAPDKGGTAYD